MKALSSDPTAPTITVHDSSQSTLSQPFTSLPRDVLLIIFGLLSAQDFLNTQYVCKTFNRTAKSAPHLWMPLVLRAFPQRANYLLEQSRQSNTQVDWLKESALCVAREQNLAAGRCSEMPSLKVTENLWLPFERNGPYSTRHPRRTFVDDDSNIYMLTAENTLIIIDAKKPLEQVEHSIKEAFDELFRIKSDLDFLTICGIATVKLTPSGKVVVLTLFTEIGGDLKLYKLVEYNPQNKTISSEMSTMKHLDFLYQGIFMKEKNSIELIEMYSNSVKEISEIVKVIGRENSILIYQGQNSIKLFNLKTRQSVIKPVQGTIVRACYHAGILRVIVDNEGVHTMIWMNFCPT